MFSLQLLSIREAAVDEDLNVFRVRECRSNERL
jgi:hypothetical protein